jgi:hypothetical protein
MGHITGGQWFYFQIYPSGSTTRFPGNGKAMKSTTEILLVDDNPADLDLTTEMLSRGEFSGRVCTVNDGAEANRVPARARQVRRSSSAGSDCS